MSTPATEGAMTAPREVSPITLATAVLRQSKLLSQFAGAGLVLSLLVRLFVLTDYTADARFRPQSSPTSGPSGLAGVAAQFGLDLGGSVEGSPAFYSALLGSRDLLRRAVTTEYVFVAGGDTLRGTLVERLDASGDTPEGKIRTAMGLLRGRITTTVDATTGLVLLRVEMPWPALAEKVNRKLLDLVSDYNVEVRQSKATAEKKFVEARLEAARASLTAAQDVLQQFLSTNLQFQQSPRLQFEAQRLQAEVTLQQSVYSTLAQSYEQSRIQEVRDTPVITVVEQPEASARPAFPAWWIFSLFGAFAGLVMGVGFGLAREYLNQRRASNPDEFRELSHLSRELAAQVAAFGDRMRRRRPRSPAA